uniref:alpha/beta hydrolase n=1 Tax=Flavobacterium sp. TaxID=239 RepID=UPI004049EBD2
MNTQEKVVTYKTSNTYETLNKNTNRTKHVWLVFHGIGYLSRYFLKYFKDLDPEENYIIAPQAPSKYYLNGKYVHVGASWLTKENTAQEIQNINQYINAVLEAEAISKDQNLIVFGFSQGVSIATRYTVLNKLKCQMLVLYAGGIPNELKAEDFTFLEKQNTTIKIIVGDQDEYLNKERMQLETKKITSLFNNRAEIHIFNGGHEVKKDLIKHLV